MNITFNSYLESADLNVLQNLAQLHSVSIANSMENIFHELQWLYRNKPDMCAADICNASITTSLRSFKKLAGNAITSGGVVHAEKFFRQILKFAGLNDASFDREKHPKRPYQLDAQRAILDGLGKYSRPICLSLATGGGKTRVANDFLMEWLEASGGIVIWLTKDWWLLDQAVSDFFRRHDKVAVHRYGGTHKDLPFKPFSSKSALTGIVYTTVQTCYKRLNELSDLLDNVSLVVWDECHWAQNSPAGRAILDQLSRVEIPVLGLTATPRADSTFEIVYQRTFFDLVNAEYLAKPNCSAPVKTGVNWTPTRINNGDFDAKSLERLSRNNRRNAIIARHYREHSAAYQQTLVFACNVQHADLLVEKFSDLGIPAAPIHSQVQRHHRDGFIQDFKQGAKRVLVTVDMLTHGVDLPFVQSIFLCRPTTSDILFAQMIGRGTRKTPTKDSFRIVEFTDNVKRHSDVLVSAKTYFSGSNSGSADVPNRRQPAPPEKHAFDPAGLPCWIPQEDYIPKSIQGLWLRRGQTFGIEFELVKKDAPWLDPSDPEWGVIAKAILAELRTVTSHVAAEPFSGYAGHNHFRRKNTAVWNVEYDSTVNWEVTSRVLADVEGYHEVARVCEVLEKVKERYGLSTNFQTGTHIHLGWGQRPVSEISRLVKLVRLAEPALATLVAPSRIVMYDECEYDVSFPNQYCAPLSKSLKLKSIKNWRKITSIQRAHKDRYVTLNLEPLFNYGTVEVRMHNGTISASKILLWLSLWQQILWAASVKRPIPRTEDCSVIVPSGDIVAFAQRWLPSAKEPAQVHFLKRLVKRRAQIVERWKRRPELQHWVAFKDNWMVID